MTSRFLSPIRLLSSAIERSHHAGHKKKTCVAEPGVRADGIPAVHRFCCADPPGERHNRRVEDRTSNPDIHLWAVSRAWGNIVNEGVWAEMLEDRKFNYPITSKLVVPPFSVNIYSFPVR